MSLIFTNGDPLERIFRHALLVQEISVESPQAGDGAIDGRFAIYSARPHSAHVHPRVLCGDIGESDADPLAERTELTDIRLISDDGMGTVGTHIPEIDEEITQQIHTHILPHLQGMGEYGTAFVDQPYPAFEDRPVNGEQEYVASHIKRL